MLDGLKALFKDEVRALGKALGLSHEVIWRHPFPGPGLGVRVIGDITAKRLTVLKEADAILIEEMKRSGYYYKVWQAFVGINLTWIALLATSIFVLINQFG